MTYALAWPLQQAVFALLTADAACAGHFGGRIYDAPPHVMGEPVPNGLYLTFGDEQVADWSTAESTGAVHTIGLTVNAPRRGYADAKQAAAAVSDAILNSTMAPSRGNIVNARFVDAKTRRVDSDTLRQIDLRFRITIEDTA